ncbi:ergothioneine biosynthesis protein EgtC [Pannus brasiliensis CCIBt3594]|uniref:Ergothioneine biosynthesis protein EgtC n=1 Tax=Pannus brasiliensis CCIBt3594 TaxID=1427578 RepID=A0AAW9QR27_9CHRO
MCRLLGYLGRSIELDRILCKPEHSLIVQSYQPREMTAGVVNADGFGVGWYHPTKDTAPYRYQSILPIWGDVNLPSLSRYVETGCTLAYVRSATPPATVDFSSCQPFTFDRLLFVHNGFIHNFRQTLYRRVRELLSDEIYRSIQGTTDSEHIFALILHEWQNFPEHSLDLTLQSALHQLTELAKKASTYFSANTILSDGKQLVASRYSNRHPVPSLYWLRDDPNYPDSVIIASEPLFRGDWNSCPENSVIRVGENLDLTIHPIA